MDAGEMTSVYECELGYSGLITDRLCFLSVNLQRNPGIEKDDRGSMALQFVATYAMNRPGFVRNQRLRDQ